jgi:hypothetical protein
MRSWRHVSAVATLAALLSGAAGAQGVSPETLKALGKVVHDYRIQVVASDPGFPVKTMYGMIDGRGVDARTLDSYVPVFAAEFSVYPSAFVKRSQLKRVVLCTDLTFAGQRRNAIPDYEHETLYLDASRGSYSKSYQRKLIHHELFHIVDYRDDGEVYTDARWAALNPSQFRYGSGGRNAQDIQTTSVLTDKLPGFLNHYSTTGVEEDKAEVLANLIVDPDYVDGRAAQDRVLRTKVERLKELLVSFSPEMNDQFWERIRATRRGAK